MATRSKLDPRHFSAWMGRIGVLVALACVASAGLMAQITYSTTKSNIKTIAMTPGGTAKCIALDGSACTAAQVKQLTANTAGKGSIKVLTIAADGVITCDGKACTAAQIAELNNAVAAIGASPAVFNPTPTGFNSIPRTDINSNTRVMVNGPVHDPARPCPPGQTWDGTKCAGTPVGQVTFSPGASTAVGSAGSTAIRIAFQRDASGKTWCKTPDGKNCAPAHIQPLTAFPAGKSIKGIALAPDGSVNCDGKPCTAAQLGELNGAAAAIPGANDPIGGVAVGLGQRGK